MNKRKIIAIAIASIALIAFLILGYINEQKNFTHNGYAGTVIGKYENCGRSVNRYIVVRLTDGRQTEVPVDGYQYQLYKINDGCVFSLREFDITNDSFAILFATLWMSVIAVIAVVFILVWLENWTKK